MKQIRLRLGLVLCFSLTRLAVAQAPQVSGLTNFPMIGIIRGQTLRINLVAWPPDPCAATLGFQDSNGNPIGNTEAVSLSAGQSASLGLNANKILAVSGERAEILPTIVPQFSPNGCVASVEVFNNSTGVTKVLVPGAAGYPPTPALGQLGVTLDQTVRLNVVAYPPDPCDGTLGFTDSSGNPVGSSKQVSLNPGQSDFLDLPGNALVSATGQRAEVLPNLMTSSPTCVISAEIYNNTSLATAVFFPPDPCSQTSTSCFTF